MSTTLSDEELLRRALRLTDPYDQRELTDRVSAGVELVDVINIYEYREYPARKVFCVGCRGHHHKRGFTALLSDGKRALYGSSCGEQAFGESWTQAERRLKGLQNRKFELERAIRARLIMPDLLRALWLWESPVGKLEARMGCFDDRLGHLHSALAAAHISEDGLLSVATRVRDTIAEASSHDGDDRARYRDVRRVIGRLSGGLLFELRDGVGLLRRAIGAVETYRDLTAGDTASSTTNRLSGARRRVEDAVAALEGILRIDAAARSFFQRSNLMVVLEWARQCGVAAPADVSGDELVVRGSGDRIGMRGIEVLDGRPLALLKELRRTD